MAYEYIDHTADLGIRVRSGDLETLFLDAGSALVELLGASSGEGSIVTEIAVEGIDDADLLVRWLQELLFLIDTRSFRVFSIRIQDLAGTSLRAEIAGSRGTLPLSHEIKAVTYHGLDIRQVDNGFEATIIFDM